MIFPGFSATIISPKEHLNIVLENGHRQLRFLKEKKIAKCVVRKGNRSWQPAAVDPLLMGLKQSREITRGLPFIFRD